WPGSSLGGTATASRVRNQETSTITTNSNPWDMIPDVHRGSRPNERPRSRVDATLHRDHGRSWATGRLSPARVGAAAEPALAGCTNATGYAANSSQHDQITKRGSHTR